MHFWYTLLFVWGDGVYRRMRELREDKDLSQAQIADLLNVRQATYSRYESGKFDIPTASLIKLALIHTVSTDYILGLTDEIKPYPKPKIRRNIF